MDGVLFDTMPYHVNSWIDTAKKFNLTAEPVEFYLCEGQPGRETIRQLYRRTYNTFPSKKVVEEIYKYKTEHFLTLSSIKKISNIDAVLEYSKQAGLDIGVVTGSSQKASLMRLENHFSKYFNTEKIVTGEDVENGKPHPEPYLLGMQKLKTTPDQTIVIENAPFGVESASRSGAYTIAITTGPIPPKKLKESGADLVLKDMTSLLNWLKENV